MKSTGYLMSAVACLTGFGCFSARPSANDSFPALAARNLSQETIRHMDDRAFDCHMRKEAEQAWKAVCNKNGPQYTRAHKEGFIEGFVDYIDAGEGEPPYMPPFRYRLSKHRTEEGVRMIEEWYAGFRHGAAVARASGLRELTLVPLPGPVVDVPTSQIQSPLPVLPPADPLHTPRAVQEVSARLVAAPLKKPASTPIERGEAPAPTNKDLAVTQSVPVEVVSPPTPSTASAKDPRKSKPKPNSDASSKIDPRFLERIAWRDLFNKGSIEMAMWPGSKSVLSSKPENGDTRSMFSRAPSDGK